MSTQTITRARSYIKASIVLFLFSFSFSTLGEWKVDLSRRVQQTRSQDLRAPASAGEIPMESEAQGLPKDAAQENPGFFESLFQTQDVAQEIVLLNTDKGFIPSTLRLRKGLNYRIHVVNVNDKEKNVSFVLDSFSEHHATYYGKIKTFVIRPQKEGVFRFVSPETAAQGKMVIYAPGQENRLPASE